MFSSPLVEGRTPGGASRLRKAYSGDSITGMRRLEGRARGSESAGGTSGVIPASMLPQPKPQRRLGASGERGLPRVSAVSCPSMTIQCGTWSDPMSWSPWQSTWSSDHSSCRHAGRVSQGEMRCPRGYPSQRPPVFPDARVSRLPKTSQARPASRHPNRPL